MILYSIAMNTNIIPLKDALEKFAKGLQVQGRSSNTIIAYKGDINQFLGYLEGEGISKVPEVTNELIEGFKKYLLGKNYTAKSVSRKLNSIKSFFSFLLAEGVISIDPTIGIEYPKIEVELPKILKAGEYRALRDVCRHDARATAIIELMLQCGLRISEIANLELDDIKADSLIIRAYESHPQRTVPLNKAAKMALDRYLGERPEAKAGNIFVTKTKNPLLIRNIRSLINRYFEKAGIKEAKINDLRNTFIVHQLANGVPLEIVSKIVGHKRISTTEKYLVLAGEQTEEADIKLKEL